MTRASPGAFALVDQAAVSLGTFLTNLLLARALPLADYGTYALVYGVLLFLNGLFAGLVTYPLSVTGAAASRPALSGLARRTLALGPAMAPLAAVALGATCWTVGRIDLLPWILTAVVLWQAQETLRRALMAHLRHRDALAGDVLSYLGQAALLGVLALEGALSLEIAFGVMALTSGAAAVLQARQVGIAGRGARPPLRQLLGEFYRLGRWVLLASATGGLVHLTFQWTLLAVHGLAAVATLEALANVLKITHPLMQSVCNVAVPAVAHAAARDGHAGARRAALRHGAQGGALLGPYLVALLVRPDLALAGLYGGDSPYLALEAPLRLFVLQYAFIYVASVYEALLNGLRRSAGTFVAQSAGAAVAVLIGLPLVAHGGVVMVGAAGALANVVRTLTAHRLVRRDDDRRARAAVMGAAEPRPVSGTSHARGGAA